MSTFFTRISLFTMAGALVFLGALLSLMRPVRFVRIGLMNSERIGHLAHNTEMYLRRRNAGIEPRSIDIFIASEDVANEFLFTCAKRQLTIIASSTLTRAYQLIQAKFPRIAAWRVWVVMAAPQNNWHEINDLPAALITFAKSEEDEGQRLLQSMGVKPGEDFICFANRTSGYLAGAFADRDFSYHDYRDSSLQPYVKTAEHFAAKGLWAFRMGLDPADDLPDDRNQRVYDFARNKRSPFADVYLLAKCKFFVTGNTGNMQVCTSMKKPIVCVNLLPVGHPPILRGDIFLFKRHMDKATGKELTLREILDRGLSRVFSADAYRAAGVEVIENTEDEILQAAIELDKRLDGIWESTAEDEALQQRFWSFFPEGTHAHGCEARVAAHFLRSNQHLLA